MGPLLIILGVAILGKGLYQRYNTSVLHLSEAERVICRATYYLRELAPASSPDTFLTPMEILNLDSSMPPFSDPEAIAIGGTALTREADAAVLKAWNDVAESRMGEEIWAYRAATVQAAAMLLDHNARLIYLRDVEPDFKGKRGKINSAKAAQKLKRLCMGEWRTLGLVGGGGADRPGWIGWLRG